MKQKAHAFSIETGCLDTRYLGIRGCDYADVLTNHVAPTSFRSVSTCRPIIGVFLPDERHQFSSSLGNPTLTGIRFFRRARVCRQSNSQSAKSAGTSAQCCSESFDKTGELKRIVRKRGFVRNCGCKSQKTNWFGRGGGDRKQSGSESKGLKRNAGEC
jgi:hypothetical protein